MSAVERRLRIEPRARGRLLERVAARILRRVVAHMDDGTLAVAMPDGRVFRFGSGPETRLTIHSTRLFARVATRGSLGLGESYVAGEWDADDVAGFVGLLLRNAAGARERHPRLHRLMTARPRLARTNHVRRARRNIAYHYDLGNALFAEMLDETMTYSSAIFEAPGEPLGDAQRRKLRRVCDKLALGSDDHVLEIGCGWGSFALIAAAEYGARVTAVTISAQQAALARERVARAGLGGRVEIVERDYRLLEGSYTKVASIEMLEAIGADQWPVYFAAIDRLLAPGGRACIQTILVPDERFARYRTTPDWIERYVFPGCLIPAPGALAAAAEGASTLRLQGMESIGQSYAVTLREWRRRFHASIERVRELGYDPRFERIWEFYLASCEACFATGWLDDAQLLYGREGEGLAG